MQVAASQESIRKSPFKGFIPFFWMTLCISGGALLADQFNLPAWGWGVCFAFSVVCWVLTLLLPKTFLLTHYLIRWSRSDLRLPGVILAAVFFLGGWRFSAAQFEVTPFHAAYYNDRGIVQVIGTVIKPPDPRDTYTNLTIQVKSVFPFFEPSRHEAPVEVAGRVLIRVPAGSAWSYGDQLAVTGQFETPFEVAEFSYRDYLSRQGILSVMPYARVDWVIFEQGNPIKSKIFRLQTQGYETLQSLFPSPESDLLAGILLGRDQGLSSDLQAAFRKTGTTHIIAISGFNIVILAGLFSGIFTRLLGRKWGALTAVGAITVYTILVGGDAAVVRAAIMGCLGVLGGMFGRRQNGLNSLGVAAIAMIYLNPNILWDLGFQLSIAATLGLVLFAQPLEEWFIKIALQWVSEERAQGLVGPLSEFLLFTLAAQVMTLPLIAYHFGGVSWLALFANPLILPVQSLVMILGGLALLAGLILPGLGKLAAIIALPFVRYTVRMVSWLGHFPIGEWTIPEFHALWLVVFYGLLFYFTLAPPSQRKIIREKVVSYQASLLMAGGVIILVWNLVLTAPDGNLHLTLFDDEGTVLVQTPGGHAILVGSGESPSHLKQVIGQNFPITKRKLDLVVVGSTARSDIIGLSGIVDSTQIEQVLWGVDPEANQTCKLTYAALMAQNVPITPMAAGQNLDLGDQITLRVLWTGERGAVLWLEWKNFSALLPTGKVDAHWLDVPGAPDIVLLKDGLQVDDLPLKHVNEWSSSVILLPLKDSDLPLSGEHPLITLLAGYPVVNTLEHDWIRITTDGEHLWVYGE